MRIELEKLPWALTVCRTASLSDIGLDADFFFIGKTDEEVSLVCRTEDVPAGALEREDGWRGFRVKGPLDFSLVGVLSGLTSALAAAGIGLFAVSTFKTDYILVRETDFARAAEVLAAAGYPANGFTTDTARPPR